MASTILVVGATGRLGEPVARRLLQEGFEVRLLTRNIDRAKGRFGDAFTYAEGDAADIDQLDDALSGCWGVHISISGDQEQVGAENVVTGASRHRLERISYISGTNTVEQNAWFATVQKKLMAEKAIRESGIPYTIFCPTFAMDVLPMHVQGNRAVVFGKQVHPLHWVAGVDLARMIAAAFKTEEAVGKRLFIHGPELIRTHDAVERYCRAFHPAISNVSTMPYWLGNLIGRVTGNAGMKAAVEAYAFVDKVGELGDPSEANELLGAPETSLDEWMAARRETAAA